MNSMIYDVEFPDGQIKEYAANVISENILEQMDQEGFQREELYWCRLGGTLLERQREARHAQW